MRPLDDTDREILRLLLEDGRRPYSDIGEAVDLSGPAVSDRVERLRERGIVRGVSVDIDRSVLREGPSVLARVSVQPAAAEGIAKSLRDVPAVDHVYRTVDGAIVVAATVEDGDFMGLLDAEGLLADVADLDVDLLAESRPTPGLREAEFAPTCAECDNTVDEEGERATLDGETYYFCCGSCKANFVEQYEQLREGV
jgi:DNA-binding Lrp family transcriptional regulator